jgi:hypothetical protein
MANKEIVVTMDMLKDELFNFENAIDNRVDLKYLLDKKGIKKEFLANNMSISMTELNNMLNTPLYEWKFYHVMELVKLKIIDVEIPTAPLPKIRALKLQMEMALMDIATHLNEVKEMQNCLEDFLKKTDSVLASGILQRRVNVKFNPNELTYHLKKKK